MRATPDRTAKAGNDNATGRHLQTNRLRASPAQGSDEARADVRLWLDWLAIRELARCGNRLAGAPCKQDGAAGMVDNPRRAVAVFALSEHTSASPCPWGARCDQRPKPL